jgi:iron complex outermembrane receptor protein
MNYPNRKTAIATAVAAVISGPYAHVQAQVDTDAQIEEIVVTGSRIARRDLTAPSPVSVVTAEHIAQTGTVNLEQLLNEMPQIMPGWTNSSNFPGTGTATADLRGLGARRTLVLVNGRRYIPTNGNGTVDLSGIPTALVDRVEVMTGGASAVYGSDAIAGVVNFILDDNYEGFELGGSYDLTSEGDSAVYSTNLKFGTNYSDGKGNITVFAGSTNRDATTQDARPFTAVALDDGQVCDDGNNPSRSGICGDGSDPTAVLVGGGSTGIPASRMSLDSSAIPGTIGDNLNGNPNSIKFDNGAPLAFNDPQDRYNYAPPSYLQVPQKRFITQLFATRELNKRVNVSLEAMYMHNENELSAAPQPRFIGNADNLMFNFAANPYLTDESKAIIGASELITDAARGLPTGDGIIRINSLAHRVTSAGPRLTIRRFDVWRALVGIDGEITENLDYELYYSIGSSSNATRFDNGVDRDRWNQAVNATTDPLTGEPVCIDTSGGCFPVNPFGIDLISPEGTAFVRIGSNLWELYEQQTAGLTFVGNLPDDMSFGAGPIGTAFGLEWREETFRSSPDSAATINNTAVIPTFGEYDVSEAFVEVNIPLLADAPGADYLGLSGAYRHSDYSTVGGVDTWSYGLEWSPSFIPGLRFRGGQHLAVRAPNVIELFGQVRGAGLTIYQDPCDAESGLLQTAEQQQFCNDWGAPTGFVQLNGTVGGAVFSNPDLKAEEADTWTAGLVYQPEFLADYGVAISADYFSIDIENAIALNGGGIDNNITACFFSLDFNDPSCSNVFRERPPGSGDIETLETQLVNVTVKKVEGIDVQAEFSFDLGPGKFDVFVLSTYQFHNGFQATPALPFTECAGKFGVPCGGEIDGTGSPRWRTNTRFTWGTEEYRVSVNWRWLEGMEDARIERVAAFGLDTSDIIASIPAEAVRTDDYNYVDINASWEFNDITTLRIGFDNVFDKDPPLMGDAQIQANTDPGTYDVFGTRVWASFNLRF